MQNILHQSTKANEYNEYADKEKCMDETPKRARTYISLSPEYRTSIVSECNREVISASPQQARSLPQKYLVKRARSRTHAGKKIFTGGKKAFNPGL
jgi:hypothetical protein